MSMQERINGGIDYFTADGVWGCVKLTDCRMAIASGDVNQCRVDCVHGTDDLHAAR